MNKLLAQTDFQGIQSPVTAINGVAIQSKGAVGIIITELLKYVFPLSGILLLFFLISAGFDLMTSGGDPKKTEQGKEKLTSALVGFVIVFTAFWIYQIIKYVLGIK